MSLSCDMITTWAQLFQHTAHFTTCWNVGQLHSHSSESPLPAVFTTCQNAAWLHSHSSEFFPAVFTTCWNVGQLHSHSSKFSQLYLQSAKMLLGYTATLLSFFPTVFTACWNFVWLPSYSSEVLLGCIQLPLRYCLAPTQPVSCTITHPLTLLATP